MEKPFKGEITGWRKYPFDAAAARLQYGEDPGLGYIIVGYFRDHPEFRNTFGHTSWIMSYDEVTGEVETRNSRYRLVGPEQKVS